MCRWAAYIGAPIFLDEIIARPENSLIHQSLDARQGHTPVNADGFGVAWYAHKPEPGLFRDVMPAWADANLGSLTQHVRARLFLAHVRAATGTATSRNNCHPFVHGIWSFMHNGQVGGFAQMRRDADMLIPDALYAARRGATDSEALFLVALAAGLQENPRAALEIAAAKFTKLAQQKGTLPQLRLTAALSDGQRLYAVRYASDDAAPSLFYRWSDRLGGYAVVSEPLDMSEQGWQEVTSGSFCVFEGDRVTITPFTPQDALHIA
ncbi:MAG: class II glutamine amidotransferase [Cypionkella sp.]|nr:class II glutamine amidotransferase [Cypionkella sp.]